jgi:flagellin-like protein
VGGVNQLKKKWVSLRSEDGVSPVIATILLVAITVVLAAVLYVMVSNMGGLGGTPPPVIAFTPSHNSTDYIWTLTSIGSGRMVLKNDTFVQLKNETGFIITTERLDIASGSHGFKYTSSSAPGYEYLSAGDVITLDKAYGAGTTITLVNPGATGQYSVLTVTP